MCAKLRRISPRPARSRRRRSTPMTRTAIMNSTTDRHALVKGVRIIEQFENWKPGISVHSRVVNLTSEIPEEYLVGLSEIRLKPSVNPHLLLKKSSGSAKRKSKGLKLGMYESSARGSKQAVIEIYVQSILVPFQNKPPRLGIILDSVLADVLYHEIGHHIHSAIHPSSDSRERVAELWKTRLKNTYFRRKYPLLFFMRPMARLLNKLF
jgi:hypothetical protein